MKVILGVLVILLRIVGGFRGVSIIFGADQI
jgi:hypothetical protein